MGIYEGTMGFKFSLGGAKMLPIIGGIIAIIALLLITNWAIGNYEPAALKIEFEKNPISVGEQTMVFVTVSNATKIDAQNVPLTLEVKEQTEFDIFPLNEKFNGVIGILSSETSRQVTFVINPVQQVLPGTYTLVAQTTINGKAYSSEVKLNVTAKP
ncbi:MAG: hypothetical protein NUV67_01865 [archaeon]|nr:hypothetical protein [archaeon]